MAVLLGAPMVLPAQEQSENPFISPFDFPLLLSGNFGELRANHFHGGVDFKTQGVVGKPIRCIAEGYISRVTVTPGGYGQAVYITHTNGLTSVHGHLHQFMEEVQKVVEAYQYEHETFAVDLEFEPDQFPLKQGEVFALAGNEGYSFGPHLHMEIRRTGTGEYIDPLQFYTDQVKDTTAPRATHVMLYPQAGKGMVNGSARKKIISLSGQSPVTAWGQIAAGIKAYDYMDGTSNNYGVRSVTLLVDSVEVFRSTVDGFLPNENRMINAWTDYEEYVSRNSWFMRSQILPGNTWRMLQADENGGVVTIDEERFYHFRYELQDLYGNKRTYSFKVKGKQTPITPVDKSDKHYFHWNRGNVLLEPGMLLVVYRGMLYDDVKLNAKVLTDSLGISYTYQLNDKPVPLHAGCPLSIGIRQYPVDDMSKYYVARLHKGRKSSAGGTFKDGYINTTIRELGTYTVALDTIAPKVVPLNKPQWKTGNIRFKIRDAETGIKNYKVYIDGEFVLFKFSSKNATLSCIDPKRIKKGKVHRMQVIVTDYCDNEVREEYQF